MDFAAPVDADVLAGKLAGPANRSLENWQL